MSDSDKITWTRRADGSWQPAPPASARISPPPPPRLWRIPAEGPATAEGAAGSLPEAIAAASDALRALRGGE